MKELDEKFIKKLNTIGGDVEKINAANQEIANGIVDFVSNAIDSIKSLNTEYDIKVPNKIIGKYETNYYIHSTVKMSNFSVRINLVFDSRVNQAINFMNFEYYNQTVLDKMLKKHNISIDVERDRQKSELTYLTIVYYSKVQLGYDGIIIPTLEEQDVEKQHVKTIGGLNENN